MEISKKTLPRADFSSRIAFDGEYEGNESLAELVYETHELVGPTRDVVLPFYIPDTKLRLDYIKMNLYFPGLQTSDYPLNSTTQFFIPMENYCLEKIIAGSPEFNTSGSVFAGNAGYGGGVYVAYRSFVKFLISPLSGFKINSALAKWSLTSIATAGAGANTQVPIILDALADYGDPDTSNWADTAVVAYGNVNLYTDTVGNVFSKAVTARIQALADASTKYACFRWKGATEPTDDTNYIYYNYRNNLLYCELAEDTSESVLVYVDDGIGFNTMVDRFSADKEDLKIIDYFTGTGKKRIKLTCAKNRRIDILVRIGLTLGEE